MSENDHTTKIIVIAVGIVILLGVIGGLGYWLWARNHRKVPTTHTKPWTSLKPASTQSLTPLGPSTSGGGSTPSGGNTPPSGGNTSTLQVPCPSGWQSTGNTCSINNTSVDLTHKTLPELRTWAQQNNVDNWEGVLCPPGYTGIGTTAYPCKSKDTSAKCQSAVLTDPRYDNPNELISWAHDCDIKSWPGITCPSNWSGLGTTTNPCVRTSTSKSTNPCLTAIATTQESVHNFKDLAEWVTKCNIVDPLYSAGLV